MLTAEAKKLNYEDVNQVNTARKRKIDVKAAAVLKYLRVGCLLFCLMITNTVIQALLAQTQHKLDSLQAKIIRVEKELGQLQYDLANLSSCRRVEYLAATKLGMEKADTMYNLQLAIIPESPREEPQTDLYLLAENTSFQNRGVVERVASWLTGLGETLAGAEVN